MSLDITEIKLFAGALVSIGGADVGHVDENGIKVNFKNKFVQAKVAKYPTEVQQWIAGQELEVEFQLAQSNFTNLAACIPGATKVTNTAGSSKLTFGKTAGFQQTAVQVIFTSVQSANTPTYDLTIPRAVPSRDWTINYDPANWNKWSIGFKCLANEAGGADGSWMATFGDASITADVVAPTVSSVVPADEATGQSTSTTVVWTISEALNGNTVNLGTVAMFKSATDSVGVPGSVALVNNGASTTITFTPTSALAGATKYICVLSNPAGSLAYSIQDLAGNKLAFYSNEFTTT